MRIKVNVHICQSDEESWDTIWRWSWFTREIWMAEYWRRTEEALKILFPILSSYGVKSILDCSCGLGFKTIIFAKRGYEVEGSDASAAAIKYAPQLAREHGFKIRFFRSRFEDLNKNCKRRYDCAFSDYFDELATYEMLRKAAEGIRSILKENGIFIFCSSAPELTKTELEKLIENEWKRRERFQIDPPVRRNGLKVIHIEVANKMQEGILESHIYLIEENEMLRAEIAQIMNPRIKWTYEDFVNVLEEAGYSKIDYVQREEKEGFLVATK